jgi:hypothetical protein
VTTVARHQADIAPGRPRATWRGTRRPWSLAEPAVSAERHEDVWPRGAQQHPVQRCTGCARPSSDRRGSPGRASMRAHLLLRHPEEILDEMQSTPQRQPTRIAAFLIRQITRLDHTVTMRSGLTVLHLFDRIGAAETAEYTWSTQPRLSSPRVRDGADGLRAAVSAGSRTATGSCYDDRSSSGRLQMTVEPQRPKKCGATIGGMPRTSSDVAVLAPVPVVAGVGVPGDGDGGAVDRPARGRRRCTGEGYRAR